MNILDRVILSIAPTAGLRRLRSRTSAQLLARHFEAAEPGRRTAQWKRPSSDANAANQRALKPMRDTARDLIRNNVWARRAQNVIATNTVGWGIVPKPLNAGGSETAVRDLWKQWGETKLCDASGRYNFYGLQRQIMRALVDSGEALIRRRNRRQEDGLPIPLQLEVLEADYLDESKNGYIRDSLNYVIEGVEFDAKGKRVAYWIFRNHPGALFRSPQASFTSYRVPADEIIHVYRPDRPGQVRGASWFSSAFLRLKDLDEFEDATIMKQKIAACFAAFVTDPNADTPAALGDNSDDETIDVFEPGMIEYLQPGKSVEFATPPQASDFDPLTRSVLRGFASGIGITYESLTGDYSMVNYSSGRLGRIEMQQNITEWQFDLIIPQFCEAAWAWAMNAAFLAGQIPQEPQASWTPPPFAMMDPEKDTKATLLAIRSGLLTFSDAVRGQGFIPPDHWDEYENDLAELDRRGIVLDTDARQRTQVGNAVTSKSTETDTSSSVSE